MTNEVPDYIRKFIEAVYPDAPDLALCSFNEQECLETATELLLKGAAALRSLDALTAERDALLAEKNLLEEWVTAWIDHEAKLPKLCTTCGCFDEFLDALHGIMEWPEGYERRGDK